MADIVVEGNHSGPAAARNRGWKASAGELVLFTDSDCIPHPDWALNMVEQLEAGADAVKGVYSSGGDRLIQRLAQIEFLERYSMLARRESIDIIDTYSAGYSREALMKTGGFDESFPFPDHEDIDLSYRLEQEGCILRFVPDARVSHNHRESLKAYFLMKFSRGRWRMKILKRYPRKAGSDSYTPLSLKVQILLCAVLFPVVALLPVTVLPLLFWGGIFLLSCIPLILIALRRERLLIPAVPLFVLLRGCALFGGLFRGIFASEEVNE